MKSTLKSANIKKSRIALALGCVIAAPLVLV